VKIAVLVASRGAPQKLQTVLRVMQELSSGLHKIVYIVGVDNDDVATCVYTQQSFGGENDVIISMADPPVYVGCVWNRCAKVEDADVYVVTGDDQICITQNWDMSVAFIVQKEICASGLFVPSPNLAMQPIFRRSWLEAVGYVFCEYFPYWFNDTWWQELYEFSTGQCMKIFREFAFGGKIGKTRGMRELDYWWGAFNAMRTLRIAEAMKIRAKLGLPGSDISRFVDVWDARDRTMKSRIPEFEAQNPTQEEPPERYLIAKQKMDRYLKDHNLELWSRL
jgi:hypothetical protein